MPQRRTHRWLALIAASLILTACGAAPADQGQPPIPPLACTLELEQVETTALDQQRIVLDAITIPLVIDQADSRTTDVDWRDMTFSAVVIPQDSGGAATYGPQLLVSLAISGPATPTLGLVTDTYVLKLGQAFENVLYQNFTGRRRADYPAIPGTHVAYTCQVVDSE